MSDLKKATDEATAETQETEQTQESTNDTEQTSTNDIEQEPANSTEQAISQQTDTTQSPKDNMLKKFSFNFTKELKVTMFTAFILWIVFSLFFYNRGYHSQIDDEVLQLNDRYTTASEQLERIKKELSQNEALLEEMEKYKENKTTLTQELSTKQAELEELNSNIAVKQSELDQLTKNIAQAKGQPISLQAGQFIVGKDVPAGRYNVSGSSNFIVHDGFTGRSKVNTILGDGYVGSGDYICTLDTGDEIKNHAPAVLTPIE